MELTKEQIVLETVKKGVRESVGDPENVRAIFEAAQNFLNDIYAGDGTLGLVVALVGAAMAAEEKNLGHA